MAANFCSQAIDCGRIPKTLKNALVSNFGVELSSELVSVELL